MRQQGDPPGRRRRWLGVDDDTPLDQAFGQVDRARRQRHRDRRAVSEHPVESLVAHEDDAPHLPLVDEPVKLGVVEPLFLGLPCVQCVYNGYGQYGD